MKQSKQTSRFSYIILKLSANNDLLYVCSNGNFNRPSWMTITFTAIINTSLIIFFWNLITYSILNSPNKRSHCWCQWLMPFKYSNNHIQNTFKTMSFQNATIYLLHISSTYFLMLTSCSLEYRDGEVHMTNNKNKLF